MDEDFFNELEMDEDGRRKTAIRRSQLRRTSPSRTKASDEWRETLIFMRDEALKRRRITAICIAMLERRSANGRHLSAEDEQMYQAAIERLDERDEDATILVRLTECFLDETDIDDQLPALSGQSTAIAALT
jgi:hypothetical protein